MDNFNETNHATTCPNHGLTACRICHVVAGECDSGGCTRKASRTFHLVRSANNTIGAVRSLCASPVCEMIARQSAAGVATMIEV